MFCNNTDVGLKAIIAIHNTTLGPALGGLRMWPYESEQEALDDVLRLSKGMTYKAAVSGLNLGGGKSVIIGDPRKDKSEALFRALGKFIDTLHGRYITAEDVGIDVNDMEYIFQETNNVVGVHQVHGGSGDRSKPSSTIWFAPYPVPGPSCVTALTRTSNPYYDAAAGASYSASPQNQIANGRSGCWTPAAPTWPLVFRAHPWANWPGASAASTTP